MNIIIKPLTKELKDDYLFFFDNMIFKENPDWSSCYCYDYHFTGEPSTCTRASNRAAVIDLINENKFTGYLVYTDEKPIGWCNTNDRSNYQRLLKDYDYVDNPDDKVCSIVCFLIHPDYRRQGIAQKILENIIQDYSKTDYDFIEAYPRKEESSSSSSFKGPRELYERNGFKLNKEDAGHYVMRKKLNKIT